MTNRLINRNTKTITFSLPPEMAEQVEDVMREEGHTMSELICAALRNYMEERDLASGLTVRAGMYSASTTTGERPGAVTTMSGRSPGWPEMACVFSERI